MKEQQRMERAVRRMESLYLPKKFVEGVAREALKVYGDWAYLEAEDYRLLADMCFDQMEKDSLAIKSGVSMRIKCSGVYSDEENDHSMRQEQQRPPKRRVLVKQHQKQQPCVYNQEASPSSFSTPRRSLPRSCKMKLEKCEATSQEVPPLRKFKRETDDARRDASAAEELIQTVEPLQSLEPDYAGLSFIPPGVRRFLKRFPGDTGESASPSGVDKQVMLFSEPILQDSFQALQSKENQAPGTGGRDLVLSQIPAVEKPQEPQSQLVGKTMSAVAPSGVAIVKSNQRALSFIAQYYSDDED